MTGNILICLSEVFVLPLKEKIPNTAVNQTLSRNNGLVPFPGRAFSPFSANVSFATLVPQFEYGILSKLG